MAPETSGFGTRMQHTGEKSAQKEVHARISALISSLNVSTFFIAALYISTMTQTWTGPAAASSIPEVELTANVTFAANQQAKIRGTMKIHQWARPGPNCVYVPYADSNYGTDRGSQRRMNALVGRRTTSDFSGGGTIIDVKPPAKIALLEDHEAIVRIVMPSGWGLADALELTYESAVPEQPGEASGENQSERIFDGFHPTLLSSCPTGSGDDGLPQGVAAKMHGKIHTPEGTSYAGPPQLSSGALAPGPQRHDFIARRLVFAVTKQMQVRQFDLGQEDIKANLFYRSPSFAELETTLSAVFPILEDWFGPYPYPNITVVETTELQRNSLPGVIALNRPRQSAFNTAQSDFLNWNHWMIVRLLATQWYGAAVATGISDDDWLVSGIAEFATEEALRSLPQRYDLFGNSKWASVTFLQAIEYSAASLRRFAPFARLTDSFFRSAEPRRLQHPFLYAKHAMALRQLRFAAGQAAFSGFFRALTKTYLFKDLTPKRFYDFLDRKPSPFAPALRQELKKSLALWWNQDGWPDFEIADVTTTESPEFAKTKLGSEARVTTRVDVRQVGEIDFAPIIRMEEQSGRISQQRAVRKSASTSKSMSTSTPNHIDTSSQRTDEQNLWSASFATKTPLETVWVDPDHEGFDADRFDNSTKAAKVKFFPGSARNLADDGYTVVWVPYPFRRPGEPPGLGIQGALFRYIYGGLFYTVEYAPSGKLTSFKLRHRYTIPSAALSGDLQIQQNFEGDRQIETTAIRAPLFPGPLHFSLRLAPRYKVRVGAEESRHGTFAIGLGAKPAGEIGVCGAKFSSEYEHAPRSLSQGFSYRRALGSLEGGCGYGRSAFGTRLFAGQVESDGTPPDQALFKLTDPSEARLNIDIANLERVERIYTLESHILFPLVLPLPSDSLILTRRLKGSIVHNYGIVPKIGGQSQRDYSSAGLGLIMPFGGDLSGAGSISILKLSFLAILYTNADGEISRKPSYVFGLSGSN